MSDALPKSTCFRRGCDEIAAFKTRSGDAQYCSKQCASAEWAASQPAYAQNGVNGTGEVGAESHAAHERAKQLKKAYFAAEERARTDGNAVRVLQRHYDHLISAGFQEEQAGRENNAAVTQTREDLVQSKVQLQRSVEAASNALILYRSALVELRRLKLMKKNAQAKWFVVKGHVIGNSSTAHGGKMPFEERAFSNRSAAIQYIWSIIKQLKPAASDAQDMWNLAQSLEWSVERGHFIGEYLLRHENELFYQTTANKKGRTLNVVINLIPRKTFPEIFASE